MCDVEATGLYFVGLLASLPGLLIGTTTASFQLTGILPSSHTLLYNSVNEML